MSVKEFLVGCTVGCGVFAVSVHADAQQSRQLNPQTQALQDEVRSISEQLRSLKSEVDATQRDAAATSAAVAGIKGAPPSISSGVVVSMTNNRPTISSADGQNSISFTGRIHWDVGDYFNYKAQNPHVRPNSLNSGENIRRARLGVIGKVFSDWNYALIYDFGGTNDSGPGGGGITSGGIENAEITYNGFRPFAIEGGIGDVPYTLDEATSSNDIMFIERSSSQVIATNIAGNDFRENFGGHWNSDRAWIGAYFTGPQTGSLHTGIAQQVGATQRATYQLLQSDRYSLHLGADAEELIKPPVSSGVRVMPSLSDRPELRIDPTTLIGAGTLGTATNPATGANVLGGELAGGFGSLYGQAEYFHYTVDRSGLSSADFDGGYVEGSYTVTGERRKYLPGAGAYSGISPEHPFQLSTFSQGNWGALELGARYSIVNLNSNYTSGAITSAGSNAVAGGKQQVITIGANWYVNNNIRFMLNYLHGWISKPEGMAGVSGAPLGSDIGAKFDAIALRTQIAW